MPHTRHGLAPGCPAKADSLVMPSGSPAKAGMKKPDSPANIATGPPW